jgi:NADPH:quinone reductase-like Zn-dependent oxidoreductase
MADNVAYTPGAGATIAADEIGGVLFQRVKPTIGEDGSAVDVSASNPMPTVANQSDNLLRMLSRLVKILECNAVVDQQQRQRVTIDAITGSLTLGTVTTVGTVTTLSTVSAQTTLAGMDREMYINIAKNTYANSIRSQLTFN